MAHTFCLRARNLNFDDDDDAWLDAFHQGDRDVLAAVYEEYYSSVWAGTAPLASPVDRENVAHDVFCTLIERPDKRASFKGGRLGGWLFRVARNASFNYARRHRRVIAIGGSEDLPNSDAPEAPPAPDPEQDTLVAELRTRLADCVRKHVSAERWPAFEACFLRCMSRRAAGAVLGVAHTTLNHWIRSLSTRLRRCLREVRP